MSSDDRNGREPKVIHNYCSWEAGKPCGNKQPWILKHTEGQKGRSWAHVKQGDGINALQPSHPAQTQDIQRTDYLKQKMDGGKAK